MEFSLIEEAGLAFLYSGGLQTRITQEDKAMVGVFCTQTLSAFVLGPEREALLPTGPRHRGP